MFKLAGTPLHEIVVLLEISSRTDDDRRSFSFSGVSEGRKLNDEFSTCMPELTMMCVSGLTRFLFLGGVCFVLCADDEVMLNVLRCQLTYVGQVVTNAKACCNNSLRPRKPEGSLGRTAQDVYLDSHTAPEL